MKINKINIHGGNVTFADKINKLVYNQNFGISENQFSELINALKELPAEKQSIIEKDFEELAGAQTEEQKKSIGERIKSFLIDNAIPVAHSLTASIIFELAKRWPM